MDSLNSVVGSQSRPPKESFETEQASQATWQNSDLSPPVFSEQSTLRKGPFKQEALLVAATLATEAVMLQTRTDSSPVHATRNNSSSASWSNVEESEAARDSGGGLRDRRDEIRVFGKSWYTNPVVEGRVKGAS